MNIDYIPHQNLEDPSNIIENSKRAAHTIFNNNNHFTNINQQIKDQNEYINDLKNEIELSANDINNNIEKNIICGNETENIKLTIYQKLALASNQLLQAQEQIKFLTQENISLKNIIANKDKIISDFEDLTLQFKQKFQKLELINDNLKQQLISKNYEIKKNINENNLNYNYNYNYDYKKNNIHDIIDFNNNKNNNTKINDNFNNLNNLNNYDYKINNDNIIDYNIDNNNNINEYINIEEDKKINYNLQLNNNELIYSINNIKKDLELIENDYQIKLKEKDCYIEQLNCELINIYKEYVKLSDILEELNYIVKNSNYNELKTEFNCLLREKEILLKEKEKDHMEILSLRERFMQKPYDCRNINPNNNQNSELLDIFSQKEKNYMNEIDVLKDNLLEKEKEIEELKNRQETIIREYELKIENLMKN